MTLAAAHALLQVVMAFLEGILRDRHHRVVELRHQHVAGGDEDLALVRLGARLIEALAQVRPIEADKIDDRLQGNPNRLACIQVEYETDVAGNLPFPEFHLWHETFLSPNLHVDGKRWK